MTNTERARRIPRLVNMVGVAVAAAALVLLAIVAVVINNQRELHQHQRDLEHLTQRLVEDSCGAHHDTRVLFSDVFTLLGSQPEADESAAEKRRERELADKLEDQLRQLPERCERYVDEADIRIDLPQD